MTRQGVDCFRFVVLMLDWLHGWDSSKLPTPPKLPKQTALHNKRMATNVVLWTKKRYPHIDIKPDDGYAVEPGDVIVCRNQVNEGHGLIGGSRRNEAWHSINSPLAPKGGCVFKTSYGWCKSTGIVCVFRPTESLLCC